MPVSERERQPMRRIGDIEAGRHEEAGDRHLALPLEERLRRSWMLFLSLRSAANLGGRRDDPSLFFEQSRALGLHEG